MYTDCSNAWVYLPSCACYFVSIAKGLKNTDD